MKKMISLILALILMMCSPVFAEDQNQEEISSTFEIRLNFAFYSRENTDLLQINNLLDAMVLNEVEIDEFDGYLAKDTVYVNDVLSEVNYRYGFDEGKLICRRVSNENLRRYRIDQYTFGNDTDQDVFIENWKRMNPDRRLDTVYTIQYDAQTACIILHYEVVE